MLKRLWLPYHQWYVKYSGFSNPNEKEDLSYFRNKLFVSILILTLALGLFSYVFSAIMAVALDKWFVFFIDSIAVSILLFLFLNNHMRLETKKTVYSITFFLLSFGLILDLGLNGNGTIMLLMLSVLMTLYSGKKAGAISVLVSAVFYLVILIVVYFNWIDLQYLNKSLFEILLIVFINNVLFGLLAVFSVSFLVGHLHNALLKENQLQEELLEKHKNVIIAKERAEESDRLKSAFLTNMSHEIRTPMYGILGCAELLKSYDVDDGDFKEYLDVIEGSGQGLLDAMTDILNISKVESGLMTLSKSSFNINNSIETIYNQFLPQAELKNIRFTLNNSISKSDAVVNSDFEKFTVVLKHLVENAIKYSSRGDTILLSCSLDTSNTQLQFILKDTGIGIPTDKQETIFSPFYQVDVENKNALHGSGIGLSISRAYVKMLGGDLILESVEGEGTSFMFHIDLKTN